jgi:hypothetical protein
MRDAVAKEQRVHRTQKQLFVPPVAAIFQRLEEGGCDIA